MYCADYRIDRADIEFDSVNINTNALIIGIVSAVVLIVVCCVCVKYWPKKQE